MIIAKIKSKADFEAEIKVNFYNIYSIIKKIFRKKNEEFYNRYHESCSVTVIDPSSGHRIVDEVEFY